MGHSATYTLITGASSGIGRATALKLASARNLILHGRDARKLEQTRASCVCPGHHLLWTHDLKRIDTLDDAFQAFLHAHSAQVGALVHSAGVALATPMRLANPCLIDELMRVNFSSAAILSSLLLRKKINGSNLKGIVFVSSIASRSGVRGFNIYSATKGALDSLMKSLAVELAPGVRVNSVLPGGLPPASDDLIRSDPEILRKLKERVPLGLGAAADVAAMVEFLLSDSARWITGQQIVVDGGFTANATL